MTREPRCPACGSALTIDTTAEVESIVFVQNRGGMPYLDRRRRPATVAFCSGCEFVHELQLPPKRRDADA